MSSGFSTPALHVALCCDASYLLGAAVTIQSILDTSANPDGLRFWLVTTDTAAPGIRPIERLTRTAGAELIVVDAAPAHAQMQSARSDRHLSTATYYRLCLPELLPSSVERVLYLDCDLLVRAEVEGLFETDLAGAALGAVLNPRSDSYRRIGLGNARDYFNAGVLLLDLARLRRTREHQLAAEFARNNPTLIPAHDQDALNHVLAGNWRRLDLRWNQQLKFFRYGPGQLGLTSAELRRLRRAPFIVHFSSASKPWHYDNAHPFRRRWFETLDRTPLAGWRPRPANLAALFRRAVALALPASLEPEHLRNEWRPGYHELKARCRRLFATRPAFGSVRQSSPGTAGSTAASESLAVSATRQALHPVDLQRCGRDARAPML